MGEPPCRRNPDSIVFNILMHVHSLALRELSNQLTPAEEDIPFVEQLSKDFFCPVTFDLLLQPHLTACCGKHLSQKAATLIQREGGRCPMCNEPQLKTMLDHHFRRQVNYLSVFCHNKDRGCGWQGELSDLERHVQSCPMKPTTDLQKLINKGIAV